MAQGRRVERVAALIRREVSELLVTGIKDERVSLGMVSITNVDVAGDLQHCKIFVSVYGSAEVQQQALEGLRSASNYVKGELGRRLNMRRTPEVIFQLAHLHERRTGVGSASGGSGSRGCTELAYRFGCRADPFTFIGR